MKIATVLKKKLESWENQSCLPLVKCSAAAMRVNGKAGYMNNITLVYNKFKEVTKIIGPTDTVWADFIGYENGISTSVELGIREHWERFPIKVFEGKHSFS